MTNWPRISTSPSSASLISAPGAGGPTLPVFIRSGGVDGPEPPVSYIPPSPPPSPPWVPSFSAPPCPPPTPASIAALSFSHTRGTAKNQVGRTSGRYATTWRGSGQQVVVNPRNIGR